jgi:NAD(P)-dependent dehydrogenase (short-subunit alcohol dehydrogenase family)
MASLHSTIVLITGANKGIGFEIAKKLAKEQPSYHILMGSRDPKRGEEAAAKLQAENLSVETITIDVTSDESISTAASAVLSKFGRLDVLINNSGIAVEDESQPGNGSLRDRMLECYNVNVFGAMQTFETFTPLLEKSSNPRVVFISSGLGSFGNQSAMGNFAVYRSSKSAINMLAMTYAYRYKEKGWKINSCCPGYVATDLNNFRGVGKAESGAINAVRLATLGKYGETGTYSDKEGPFPW